MSAYFLYGYYGYGNFGDDLLLRGVIEGIRARDPAASFLVHSLASVPSFAEDAGVRFTGLAQHLQNIRARPAQLALYCRDLWRWIARSDVLVIGGGTLFIDKGRFNPSLALLYAAILIAKLRGKRVIILGVGVDQLRHPVSRWLTRRIFAAAEFVAVREASALPYIAHVAEGKKRLAADLALPLDLGSPVPQPGRARPVAGFCFIDYYRTAEPSPAGHAAYESAIIRMIERNQTRWDFACITFQRGIGQRDDWLVPMLQDRFPGVVIVNVDDIESARRMAGAVDLLVTTRFHLGILGLLWDKAVLVIDHELKMASLASDFALPSLSLAAFIRDPGLDLSAALDRNDRERTSRLRAAQRERAMLNFAWLDR